MIVSMPQTVLPSTEVSKTLRMSSPFSSVLSSPNHVLFRLIRRLTNEHNAPMPTIDIAHQHLLTARAINERRLREGTNNAIPNLDWR